MQDEIRNARSAAEFEPYAAKTMLILYPQILKQTTYEMFRRQIKKITSNIKFHQEKKKNSVYIKLEGEHDQ